MPGWLGGLPRFPRPPRRPRPARCAPRVPAPAPPTPCPRGHPTGAGGWSAAPGRRWRRVTVTAFPISARPAARRRVPAEARGPPSARPRRGLALPRRRFSPAPRRRFRHSGTAGQDGEAGAPAARKMVTSAGQLALFALGTYAACGAPGHLPSGHPAFPLFPPVSLSRGVLRSRSQEEREANAFEACKLGRQRNHLMPTRDLGACSERGTVERSAVPRKSGRRAVRENARQGEGGAVCERAEL